MPQTKAKNKLQEQYSLQRFPPAVASALQLAVSPTVEQSEGCTLHPAVTLFAT
jgi:hypothetical protein